MRQDLATTVQFDQVASEYAIPVQVAGLRIGVIDACKSDAATPDAFRRSLLRQLQHTLPRTVPASVRADASTAPAAEFAKTEQRVKAAIIEQAHQSPTLRAVVTHDRAGREETTFFGRKSSWMGAYQAPPMLTKAIGGAPVRLPVIL